MRARRALAWYFGLGAAGYVGWRLFRVGFDLGFPVLPANWPLAFASKVLFAAFTSAALALVTLVPAAFEARRGWLWRTAALLPATVAAFVVEQLEEALVPGGAEATLFKVALVGFATLAACGWLALRADRPQRAWMAVGLLPAAGLATISIWAPYGAAQVAALALAAIVAAGLGLTWLRPLPTEAAERTERAARSDPS